MPPQTNTTPTPTLPTEPTIPEPVSMPPAYPQPPLEPAGKAKKVWLTIAGIVLALAIVAGGAWFWSRSAASQFVNAVPAYETRTKESYDYFMGLSDRLTHGEEIGTKFEQTIASAPQEPKLLGMSLAPADKVKRVADLTSAMQQFKANYVEAAAISSYSEDALKAVAAVTGTINSPDAMRAILPKLEQAKSTIAGLKHPDSVKTFHADILAKYDAVIKDLNDAVKAYDAGKNDSYLKSVEKLPADVKAISPNAAGQDLAKIFNTTYDKADKAFGDLQKLLGIN